MIPQNPSNYTISELKENPKIYDAQCNIVFWDSEKY